MEKIHKKSQPQDGAGQSLLRQVDEKQLARSEEKVFRKYRLGNFSVACTAIFSVGFLVLLFFL